jgi:hypothetical protein
MCTIKIGASTSRGVKDRNAQLQQRGIGLRRGRA